MMYKVVAGIILDLKTIQQVNTLELKTLRWGMGKAIIINYRRCWLIREERNHRQMTFRRPY